MRLRPGVLPVPVALLCVLLQSLPRPLTVAAQGGDSFAAGAPRSVHHAGVLSPEPQVWPDDTISFTATSEPPTTPAATSSISGPPAVTVTAPATPRPVLTSTVTPTALVTAAHSATHPGTPARGRGPADAGTCPSGWTCADIGAPALPGDQSLIAGTWTITGAGAAGSMDAGSTSDQFHYVWQTLSGDGSMSAHYGGAPNIGECTKTGLMLRQSTDPAPPTTWCTSRRAAPTVAVGSCNIAGRRAPAPPSSAVWAWAAATTLRPIWRWGGPATPLRPTSPTTVAAPGRPCPAPM